jgi:multidrug efflux system membrane fusion protein
MVSRLGVVGLCAALAVAIGFAGTSIAQPSTTQSSTNAASPPADTPAVPVTVAPVTRQDVPVFAEGIGTVQAFQSVLIQARVTGWLDRIAFAEGQDVKPGDLLAEIDPRPYAAALAQAQAKSTSDQATLANDVVNLKRDSTLAQRSFATQQQVDNDAAAVRVMQAAIQGDAATVQTAALNLSFCQVTAPIEGVVGLRLIDAGNLIQAGAGQGIVTITQIQPISVVFTLPQNDLPQIQAAQAAQNAAAAGKPLVVAYGQDDRTALDNGELVAASNSISAGTGTITLKAIFPNTGRHLWPGQFVNAHLRLAIDRNAVTVPVAAIQHGPDGLYVFVVGANSTVASRPVSIGYQNQTVTVVTKGLDGGEQVVVAGQSRLQDGTRIASQPGKAAT